MVLHQRAEPQSTQRTSLRLKTVMFLIVRITRNYPVTGLGIAIRQLRKLRHQPKRPTRNNGKRKATRALPVRALPLLQKVVLGASMTMHFERGALRTLRRIANMIRKTSPTRRAPPLEEKARRPPICISKMLFATCSTSRRKRGGRPEKRNARETQTLSPAKSHPMQVMTFMPKSGQGNETRR